MQDDDEPRGVSWRAIGIFGGLLLVGLVAVLALMPQWLPEEQGELVIIEAPSGSFKAKPVDAGGKKITNQDSAVMEMLGDLSPGSETVETLVPPSDEPELPPVKVKPEPETKTETETAANTGAGTDERKTATKAPTTPKAPKANSDSNAATIVATPKAVDKPVQKPATAPAATIKKKKIVVDGNEPAYMVQLAAFRDANIAAEQAGLLATKHQSRLQGVSMGTMRIDTGDNGVFWRIVSEPLPRAAADKVCANLKRAGQDCILRKFISPTQ